jgi:hypothetical protein
MTDRDTTAWSVRAIASLGVVTIGFAVVQPWGFFDNAGEPTGSLAQAADIVLGSETVTGPIALGLALLGGAIVFLSWNFRSVVALSGLGALIELFGLVQVLTYPPEATDGPLYLLGGGALVLCGGLLGVVEFVRYDEETISSASVAVAGGFLVAISPFLGYADCLGQDRPCFEYLLFGSELQFVASFVPLALVLVLTRTWNPSARRMTTFLGAISFVLGAFATALILIPGGVSSTPIPLANRLSAYLATVGSLLILAGGLYSTLSSRPRKPSQPERGDQPVGAGSERRVGRLHRVPRSEILAAVFVIVGVSLLLAPASKEISQSGLLLMALGATVWFIDWVRGRALSG